jgi:hypothetical protein
MTDIRDAEGYDMIDDWVTDAIKRDEPVRFSVVVDRVRNEHPELSYQKIRTAIWSMLADGAVTMLLDQRLVISS